MKTVNSNIIHFRFNIKGQLSSREGCGCLVVKLCLTLCDPMDCSPPGSYVHGISQARILEWLPFLSPGDLSNPGIKPVSRALAEGFFTTEPSGKPTSTGQRRAILGKQEKRKVESEALRP